MTIRLVWVIQALNMEEKVTENTYRELVDIFALHFLIFTQEDKEQLTRNTQEKKVMPFVKFRSVPLT